MQKLQNISQEESEIKKLFELISRNYKFFLIGILLSVTVAFLINRYTIPLYKITSSMLIKQESPTAQQNNVNEYINSGLFGVNENFQNELWVLKSTPVIEQTIWNLDLQVNYFYKSGFQYLDAYETSPFKVVFLKDHVQPVGIRFEVSIQDKHRFHIKASDKDVKFKILDDSQTDHQADNWAYETSAKFGKLIETPEMAFILLLDTTKKSFFKDVYLYSFNLTDISMSVYKLKQRLEFNIIEKDATVIEIALKSNSVEKGKDIINELMNVYSRQNLNQKNHIAGVTIDYIEKQLSEISDSLKQVEDNLQVFRSSNQLLNVTEQASGISAQYRDLQNQMAELVTRKRYYDYVSEYLASKNDFSDIIVPAAMGIQDQLLNNLISDLVTAQAQRSNLLQNNQEKNPLVQKLAIQIENTRKNIIENITAVRKSSEISIDEMNKRIKRVEGEISQLPRTQQELGGIERKYRLNDAIYNYLLEKRAEAKITQASNLPDNMIIEPAKLDGIGPISPNKSLNYLAALVLGLLIPFGFLTAKGMINDKIVSQDMIERLTDYPVLGKILHNTRKTTNVMFDFPKSNIAESYRLLRINLEYYFRAFPHRVLFVSSTIEGEGKSFNALNIAMSYAQLEKKTILVDFDLRKQSNYFNRKEGSLVGLSSYFSDRVDLDEIILHSPHQNLHYISSGPLPPNPVELLSLSKTKEFIEILKERYDYIILDTPPLAQVGDAYLLVEYSDIKIIIARYNYTIKKVFGFIMKDFKQKSITNVCILLNDNRFYRDQYGYGYGYTKKNK